MTKKEDYEYDNNLEEEPSRFPASASILAYTCFLSSPPAVMNSFTKLSNASTIPACFQQLKNYYFECITSSTMNGSILVMLYLSISNAFSQKDVAKRGTGQMGKLYWYFESWPKSIFRAYNLPNRFIQRFVLLL